MYHAIFGGIYKMNGIKIIRNQPLMIGFILLYILPPLGIAWLAALGAVEWTDRVRKRRPLPKDAISILFMLMALASVGAALSTLRIFYLLSTLMILGYMGVYLYYLHHHEFLQIRQYVWITIFGGVYLYLSDKFFHLFSDHSLVGQGVALMTGHLLLGFTRENRLYGSAYNPNYACYLLILALAFLLVELLRAIGRNNYRTGALCLVLLPILGLAVYDTGSRAGFIIMLLLLLLFLAKLDKRLFFAASGGIVLLSPLIFRFMPRSENTSSSLGDRLTIWKNSLHIFFEQPLFGTTPLGFPIQYFNLTGRMVSHAHDLFLSIFDSSGVFVGLFFTAIMLFSGYLLFQCLRSDKKNRYAVNLFLFSLPTIIAYGIMDFTLSSPQVMLIVLALVAGWIRYTSQMRAFTNFRSADRKVASIHYSGVQIDQQQQKREADLIHSLTDRP